MTADGVREGKPFRATHLFLTSLRTTPEALLRLVGDRWSIECWHWIRDTQLHEDAHRYRGNGAGAMGTLRTAAMNLLRLAGFQSIRAGVQAVMHGIKVLLAMVRRRPGHLQLGLGEGGYHKKQNCLVTPTAATCHTLIRMR